ncbi:MAG: SGNH/GDSL hydrolase family protein [Gammaproteobacteria bacterium]
MALCPPRRYMVAIRSHIMVHEHALSHHCCAYWNWLGWSKGSQLSEESLFLLKFAVFIAIPAAMCLGLLIKIGGWQRAKKILANSMLLVASISLALLAGELAVRTTLGDIGTTGDGSSYFSQRWYRANPVRVNSLGFREREVSPRPAPDVYRIAVVGDSFTFGQGLTEEARFTNLLERKLNADGLRYEALNFGRSGTETVDHIEILRDVVLGVNPDFILLQWYINDMEGNDHGGRPQYRRLIPSDVLSGHLFSHSALYYLLNLLWTQFQDKYRFGPGYTYSEYMVARFENARGKDSLAARWALNEFVDLCERDGVSVGFVVFPDTAEELLGTYPLGFLLDRVKDVCEQRGIPCVDLRATFADVHPASQLRVNRFDGHPGVLANSLAAGEIMKTFAPIWERLRAR